MDFGRLFHLHEFRFRWHTYTGSEFQQLFADVMQNAWQQDFQKIRPYGARGDLKCDGYWRSQRCVFQCYGPVSMREAVVIRKIEEDLPGAITHWQGRMARWAFVHNQREGLTAKVVQLLDDLRMEYPTLQIEEWTWPQIRTHFDRLSDDALVELFGYPPTTTSVHQLSFEELRPVVEQIAKRESGPVAELGKPPSETKLEKNSLDGASEALLQVGRQRVRLVEEYFEQHHDPALGDKIANAMRVQYQALTDSGLGSNEVLLELQRFAGWGAGDTTGHDVAVLAVIMYFFDRCDIFEDPDGETADTLESGE